MIFPDRCCMESRGADVCPVREPHYSLGPMHITRELSLAGVCPRHHGAHLRKQATVECVTVDGHGGAAPQLLS